MFLFNTNNSLCNYADGNILYPINEALKAVNANLEANLQSWINGFIEIEWLENQENVIACWTLTTTNWLKKIINGAEIACKDNEKIQASLSIKNLGFDAYMKPH